MTWALGSVLTTLLVFVSAPSISAARDCGGLKGTLLDICTSYNQGYDKGYVVGKSEAVVGGGGGSQGLGIWRVPVVDGTSGGGYLYQAPAIQGGGLLQINPNADDVVEKAMTAMGAKSAYGAVPQWPTIGWSMHSLPTTGGGADMTVLPEDFDPTDSADIAMLKDAYGVGAADGASSVTIIPLRNENGAVATEFYQIDDGDVVAKYSNFNALKSLKIQSIYAPMGQ